MAEPAVDDVGLADARFQDCQAGLDLGDHPLVDHPPGDQVAAFVGGQTRDQAGGFVAVHEDAGRVGQEDELLGLKRLGDGGGGGVGIDVQELAFLVLVLGQRGRTGTTPARQRFSIGGTSTSVTSPTRPRSTSAPSVVGQHELAAEEALMGLVVQPRGPAAELVDVPLDVGVDLLGQHPRDDLQRRFVGVAPSLHETGREPGLLHRHGDRLAAAVDDHRTHAHRLHEDDVDQQGAQRLGILHHRAAELDDREPAVELADVAQRLDQYVRLADGFFMHGSIPPTPRARVSERANHHFSDLSVFSCKKSESANPSRLTAPANRVTVSFTERSQSICGCRPNFGTARLTPGEPLGRPSPTPTRRASEGLPIRRKHLQRPSLARRVGINPLRV